MAYRIILAFACWIAASSSLASVAVSASIKPLQMIASAIAGEHATVSVLANDAQSAHQFSLTPSDRINIEQSQIVLWIGPEFETQLAQFLSRYEDSKALITAVEIPGLRRLELSPSTMDPHIWLGLDNAETIAAAVLQQLVELDDSNEASYRANFQQFRSQLARLRSRISNDFASIGNQSTAEFLVYHNAFQYFEAEAGLKHSLALVHDPEREPSIREILTTRDRIAAIQARCLFAEPDANQSLVESVLGDSEVRVVTLDLLGQQIEAGGYIELISRLSAAMSDCLGGNGTTDNQEK